jgi:hypothetical protein
VGNGQAAAGLRAVFVPVVGAVDGTAGDAGIDAKGFAAGLVALMGCLAFFLAGFFAAFFLAAFLAAFFLAGFFFAEALFAGFRFATALRFAAFFFFLAAFFAGFLPFFAAFFFVAMLTLLLELTKGTAYTPAHN